MDAIGSAGVGGAGGGVVGMGPAAAGAAAAGGGGGGGGGGAAAAGAAAFGAAAGAAPAAPTSTTTRGIPGLTVDPSSTKSSVILPATGDGTGTDVLSVSTSQTTSSTATASPTAFSKRMSPSEMDSANAGQVTVWFSSLTDVRLKLRTPLLTKACGRGKPRQLGLRVPELIAAAVTCCCLFTDPAEVDRHRAVDDDEGVLVDPATRRRALRAALPEPNMI